MKGARLTSVAGALPAMVPFVGPEALERARGRPFRARLGANESLFGPSPKAIAAMERAAAENWKYGDPENYDLRAALSAFHGVPIANIVVGEGIDGLLALTVRLCVEPGSAVVTSDGAYPTFNFHVAGQGGRLVKVPFRNDREDIDALLDTARREDARLLYVSNPDNPMGSWWDAGEIVRLIERLPQGTLLCLDEAYSDTAPTSALPPISIDNPQVLRLRTFSKAYGLAGARIGYAIGDAGLLAAAEKIRYHYGVNRVGQIGALAALQDQEYLASAVARIAAARTRIARIAAEAGLLPLSSAANFVTIDCRRDGAFARAILDALAARDVFVRMPGVAPLNRCIRIGAGRDGDLDILAEELPLALQDARKMVGS